MIATSVSSHARLADCVSLDLRVAAIRHAIASPGGSTAAGSGRRQVTDDEACAWRGAARDGVRGSTSAAQALVAAAPAGRHRVVALTAIPSALRRCGLTRRCAGPMQVPRTSAGFTSTGVVTAPACVVGVALRHASGRGPRSTRHRVISKSSPRCPRVPSVGAESGFPPMTAAWARPPASEIDIGGAEDAHGSAFPLTDASTYPFAATTCPGDGDPRSCCRAATSRRDRLRRPRTRGDHCHKVPGRSAVPGQDPICRPRVRSSTAGHPTSPIASSAAAGGVRHDGLLRRFSSPHDLPRARIRGSAAISRGRCRRKPIRPALAIASPEMAPRGPLHRRARCRSTLADSADGGRDGS